MVSLRLNWFVRMTDIGALPIDPATCRLTLIRVDPRATWCGPSASTAAPDTGIIVQPIPISITSSPISRTGWKSSFCRTP